LKIGAAVYESNQRGSSLAPLIPNANVQVFPIGPRYQRAFCSRIGLVELVRSQGSSNPPTSTAASTNIPIVPSVPLSSTSMAMATSITDDHTSDAPRHCRSPSTLSSLPKPMRR
uniref:LSM14 domain-containing protein n=1 Tax=Schistocephalus solidus TaxID=70667 RepID=A0A183TEQ6_SCHSO